MFGIPAPENSFPHHPTFAAAAGTDEAHTEALIVGKSLALIGWDMVTNEEMLKTAQRQWKEEIAREDYTCRRRKVKCGEERPICSRCQNLHLSCEWGVPVKRGRGSQVRQLQPAPIAPDQLWSQPEIADIVDLQPDALLMGLSPGSWTGDGLVAEAPLVAPFYPVATPLYPPLSVPEIACANSLSLTENDQNYFQYFPSSSIVFYYMKGWQWSSFCYLYQGPAAANKVIMRMILALSATDMYRNGLAVRSPGRPTAEDHGRYHYSLAVKEFRQLLETPRRHVSVAELEIIFATMFLMITYEWQFGHSIRHLQLHLHGVRSLLESHPQLFRIKDVNDVFLSSDETSPPEEDAAICRPIGLTESLYDYVLQSGNPALHPDRLHQCARLWGRCFWGEQYPDQEVLDDIENYRALELLHAGFCLRYRTWKALVDSGARARDTPDLLFRELMATRDKYSDLFITAKFAGTVSARRTLHTIYMAVSTFYAQVLIHRRLLCVDTLRGAIHRQATTGIIDIARKQFTSDPRLLRRLHWPLLMAAIETDNAVQRTWLQQRLFDLRNFHSEYVWANDVADQVLAQQEVSQRQDANLAEVLLQRLHVQ
ncbi:hypothetical protein NUU61_004647 [Penicillium alfredii]|uniref:Zn(2)-C6 fungal-type domain-containing protein n=1 Tax=Penicillium alfredii TaxID=1506179 RepID=A0A9W9FM37_9EURO|nr:uncharacterized protein NUU61_004647 [Penicillium alfredii]KAJ5102425.1 hypothetical protein NUU61_004647 [Penicillium alfredii]